METTAATANIFLDNIAIGEQTPAAPTLNAPAWGADEATVRPTLVVNNAIDFQSDPMTYDYQVFDDSGLTNMVAQIPAVAGGIDTTSWTVGRRPPARHPVLVALPGHRRLGSHRDVDGHRAPSSSSSPTTRRRCRFCSRPPTAASCPISPDV